jgi:hypothetical protein
VSKLEAPRRSVLVIGTATTCFGSKIVRIVSAKPLMVSTVATSATVAAAESPFSQPLTAAGRRGAVARVTGLMRSVSTRARSRARARSVSTFGSGMESMSSMSLIS